MSRRRRRRRGWKVYCWLYLTLLLGQPCRTSGCWTGSNDEIDRLLRPTQPLAVAQGHGASTSARRGARGGVMVPGQGCPCLHLRTRLRQITFAQVRTRLSARRGQDRGPDGCFRRMLWRATLLFPPGPGQPTRVAMALTHGILRQAIDRLVREGGSWTSFARLVSETVDTHSLLDCRGHRIRSDHGSAMSTIATAMSGRLRIWTHRQKETRELHASCMPGRLQ